MATSLSSSPNVDANFEKPHIYSHIVMKSVRAFETSKSTDIYSLSTRNNNNPNSIVCGNGIPIFDIIINYFFRDIF